MQLELKMQSILITYLSNRGTRGRNTRKLNCTDVSVDSIKILRDPKSRIDTK